MEEGKKVWYRSREEIKQHKEDKGGNSSATWHLKGTTTQTLSVPITPGGALLRKVKEKLQGVQGPDGGQTMVLEQGGASMMSTVQKKDPFREEMCRWKEDCKVDVKGDCMENNLIYRIDCQECQGGEGGWYRGQTGGSMHRRMKEHMMGLARKDIKCPLYRHTLEHHQGDPPEFKMTKSGGARSNMERLVKEAEMIGNEDEGGAKLWNSKGEYGRSKLVRFKPSSVQV